MEHLYGKHSLSMDKTELLARVNGYHEVYIDIGTGDGRYVQHMARCCPAIFVIGLDACREPLYEVSRKALPNTLYLIANAEALPLELSGLADRISINFPWGSLLTGLLTTGSNIISGLHSIACPGADLEIRLNSSALLQVGFSLEQGSMLVEKSLGEGGFDPRLSLYLDAAALRSVSTTWARRMAYGRDPHALYLRAVRVGGDSSSLSPQLHLQRMFHGIAYFSILLSAYRSEQLRLPVSA